MPNQALAYHCVSERVYDLSGLRSGSVRDQLLRSSLVVYCLADEGIIDTTARPLLIFGAGAAGVNAAITAAKLGVDADVLEITNRPFRTLMRAKWRRVDPVEYDWPQPHWRNRVFPRQVAGIPLVQSAGSGRDLAWAWAAELQSWDTTLNGQRPNGRTRILTQHDANAFLSYSADAARRVIDVKGPWNGKSPSTRTYGAILSCVGFPGERTNSVKVPDPWNGYRGPAFWTDNDGLGRRNPVRRNYDHVVISGGGDGAMQDFQRATTGWFGRELFIKLKWAARKAATPGFVDGDALVAMILAEDAGRRAHAWMREKQPLNRVLRQWHATFAKSVDDVVGPWSIAQAAAVLTAVLEPGVLSGSRRVTCVYQGETPGYSYALNRFLCLMIEKLIEKYYEPGSAPVTVRSHTNIVDIRPDKSANGAPVPEQMTPHDFPD